MELTSPMLMICVVLYLPVGVLLGRLLLRVCPPDYGLDEAPLIGMAVLFWPIVGCVAAAIGAVHLLGWLAGARNNP